MKSITYQMAFAALSKAYASYLAAGLRYRLFLMGETAFKAAIKRWEDAQLAHLPILQREQKDA